MLHLRQCGFKRDNVGVAPMIADDFAGLEDIDVTDEKIGYQFKPGHPAPSMTCREGLTALPGHGQLVNL
jgi:hypothetical protein